MQNVVDEKNQERVSIDMEIEHSLVDGEYRVYVDYDMPRDKGKLEAEFSEGGVSDLFYSIYVNFEWKNHSSCAEIDQTQGNYIMLVKHFNRAIESENAIAEMDKLGYRPATHLEAYAFAKANPELQRQFWIVALGSSTMLNGRLYVALLCSNSDKRSSNSDKRILGDNWFGYEWPSDYRFLFVRKAS